MLLDIITTTDGQNIGMRIDSALPITLGNGSPFYPDKIVIIGPGTVRLFNSSYTIDAKEV
jgi:hypothetical protein